MSALKRPLLWLLLAYAAVLVWLRQAGRLEPARVGRPGWDVLEAVIESPLREDRIGWKAEARTRRGHVLVRWPRTVDPDALPLPGETAQVWGRLLLPRPARNPGEFDERAFLADRGVGWVLWAPGARRLDRPVAWSRRPHWWAERLHRWARRRLRASLSADRARLAEGLILGYKGALSLPLNRAVQDSGLIHLIVPSGPKVAIVFAAAALVVAALRLSPRARLLVLGAPGLAVVLAAGGEPPYWRAYLAAVVVMTARACGRESDAFQALLISAWLQLLFWPRALFSAGFQMTYAALLGLLCLRPRSHLAVAVVVQAALWPIFANLFGKGALAGVVANVLAVPAYPFLAGLAWAACAAPALAPVLDLGLACFERLCRWAAALPAAAVTLSPWPWTSVVAFYAALAAIGLGRTRKGAVVLGAALALRLSAAVEARATTPALRVVYLKVPSTRQGRRHAALVTFDGRLTWLVGRAPPSLVAKACRHYGVRVDGEVESSPFLRVCRGRVCLGFEQSAIIAPPAEVSTDGLEVHVQRR